MNIMINASNLGGSGGAAQVADSICRELYKYPRHQFLVVLSASFSKTRDAIEGYDNVKVVEYSYPRKDWHSLLTKRNAFLDDLVDSGKVDNVLTIFGPVKWVPKCKHLCGIAFPHIIFPNSPFFQRMTVMGRIKSKMRIAFMSYLFKRNSDVFFTENPMVTQIVKNKWKKKKVYTVTNNFNQIFDTPDSWDTYKLPAFTGTRFFSASSMMAHKNLPITIDVALLLKKKHPSFRFQFVLTVNEAQFPPIPKEIKECFVFTGGLHISKIPSLYEQCDVVFQPSLLECFSASYPEAMKMQKPIVVPNLPFAKGLCEDAAVYYSPLLAEEAADRLYEAATDEILRQRMVESGRKQLGKYDTSVQRAEKLIKLCEEL